MANRGQVCIENPNSRLEHVPWHGRPAREGEASAVNIMATIVGHASYVPVPVLRR